MSLALIPAIHIATNLGNPTPGLIQDASIWIICLTNDIPIQTLAFCSLTLLYSQSEDM
jgi:hypothetical protein